MKELIFILLILSITTAGYCGVDFDGTDDTITCGTAVTKVSQKSFTSVRVRVDVAPASGNRDVICSLSNGALGKHNFTFEYQNNSGTFRLYTSWRIADDSTWSDWAVDQTLTVGTWYNVILSIDTSTSPDTVTFYVDGSANAAANVFGTNDKDRYTGGTHTFLMGQIPAGTLNYLDGVISDLAHWVNVVPSSADVVLLSASKVKGMPLQIQPSSLEAYWPLDDQPDGTSFNGDTAVDRSSNTNNGTGDDGGNNTGLTAKAEEVLSYP